MWRAAHHRRSRGPREGTSRAATRRDCWCGKACVRAHDVSSGGRRTRRRLPVPGSCRPRAFDAHHVQLEMADIGTAEPGRGEGVAHRAAHRRQPRVLSMLTSLAPRWEEPDRLDRDGYAPAGRWVPGAAPAQQVEKMERIIIKGQYLLDLVQDYLELARIDGGGLEPGALCRRGRGWRMITRRSTSSTPNRRRRRATALELDLPPGVSIAGGMRSALLRIVLVNLLGNGVESGRPGRRPASARGPRGGSSRRSVGVEQEGHGLRAEPPEPAVPAVLPAPVLPARANSAAPGWAFSSPRSSSCTTDASGRAPNPASGPSFSFELAQPLDLPSG